jgi:hypothetical protein
VNGHSTRYVGINDRWICLDHRLVPDAEFLHGSRTEVVNAMNSRTVSTLDSNRIL